MTGFALALVATAALFHACWNLLVKRGQDRLLLLWWTGVAGSVLFLPAVLWTTPTWRWPIELWGGVVLAALLRAAYFTALGTAYARGDLSLVYPLARGAAPVLVALLAVAALGERPTPLATVGILTVAGGVYVLHLRAFRATDVLAPLRGLHAAHVRFALLTGLLTASYSVVDKWNVSRGAPPLAYAYLTIPVAALLLTPLAVGRPGTAAAEARAGRLAIPAIALLMTSGYVLVLVALRLTPVSYVAAARELGIVFGTVLGSVVLGEGHLQPRLAGALLIVLGVLLLTA